MALILCKVSGDDFICREFAREQAQAFSLCVGLLCAWTRSELPLKALSLLGETLFPLTAPHCLPYSAGGRARGPDSRLQTLFVRFRCAETLAAF